MFVKEVSIPAAEPVSRDEAKKFCKIPATNLEDDWLIDVLRSAARKHAENCTNLSLVPRSFVLFLDEFPTFPFVGSAYAPLFGSFPFYFGFGPVSNYPTASPFTETDRLPFVIPIPHAPVTEVVKIVYIDQGGNEQTLLPGTDFAVDLGSEPARVAPVPGGRWPLGLIALSGVQVFYTAGFDPDPTHITDVKYLSGSPPVPYNSETSEFKFVSGLPADLKLAMLIIINDAYQNREISVEGAVGRVPIVDNILMANREWDFGPQRG